MLLRRATFAHPTFVSDHFCASRSCYQRAIVARPEVPGRRARKAEGSQAKVARVAQEASKGRVPRTFLPLARAVEGRTAGQSRTEQDRHTMVTTGGTSKSAQEAAAEQNHAAALVWSPTHTKHQSRCAHHCRQFNTEFRRLCQHLVLCDRSNSGLSTHEIAGIWNVRPRLLPAAEHGCHVPCLCPLFLQGRVRCSQPF